MFFESKPKKLERVREEYRLAFRERRFGDARKLAEDALALAVELGQAAVQVEASEVVADASIALTDWPRAQEVWAQTATGLRKWQLQSAPTTMRAHIRLIEILGLREQHAEAMEWVRNYGAPAYVDDLAVRVEAPLILGRLGQHQEALAMAKRLFERENATRQPARAIWAARTLAETFFRGGAVDDAISLVVGCLRGFRVTGEDTLVFRLRCENTLIEALLKRGDFNEAVATARTTLNALGPGHPPLQMRETIVAMLRMRGLQGEACAALGELDQAVRHYSLAVREVETELKNPRDVALLGLLEGYARVLRRKGDDKGAETQEKRAGVIRLQVTGKKQAPPAEAAAAPPHHAWPRRTLAGIFAIRGVNKDVLKLICEQAAAAYKGPLLDGLDVVNPDGDGQAFLLARQFTKAWDPALAVGIKHLFGALTHTVDTVNAGIALSSRGAPKISVAPWFSVADFIQCEWWTWPVEERERIKREVFPKLPGWVGQVDQHFEWLGRGVNREGTECQVAPNARMDFIPKRGIAFGVMGPPEVIDGWFRALARETQWFPAGAYEPLAPESAPAVAPMARA